MHLRLLNLRAFQILGMPSDSIIEKASDQHRLQFFHQVEKEDGTKEWKMKVSRTKISSENSKGSQKDRPITPSTDPIKSLAEAIEGETSRKKKQYHQPADAEQAAAIYTMFVDLVHKMLAFDPAERITPEEAMKHPYITSPDTKMVVNAPPKAAAAPAPAASGASGS